MQLGPSRIGGRPAAALGSQMQPAPPAPRHVPSKDAYLRIENLSKSFGGPAVLDRISMTVSDGEFLTILGASGSGKTTLLKIIAGFERLDDGMITIGGQDITNLPPARRNIGMVFQNYALFPHMTVSANVAFPLEMRGIARNEIKARVDEVLALVEMERLAERRPRQLSGGQQQRVALARAIVFKPGLLLLDEPFGALDRKLRESMQLEIRRLQQRLGLTTVFITHDQEEALVMSDRIAVFGKGCIEQVGTPSEIYDAPANPAVAAFIGESNILEGALIASEGRWLVRIADDCLVDIESGNAIEGNAEDGRVTVLIRPERIRLARNAQPSRLRGRIGEIVYMGMSTRYRVDLAGRLSLLARVTEKAAGFGVGDEVGIHFDAGDCRIIADGPARRPVA